MIIKYNFYIITGGPGVGKTTLINELKERGHRCVPEAAREIIKKQSSCGGDALPWGDTKRYSRLMLKECVNDFINLSNSDRLYFFDRGIPDTYGYELLMNFDFDPELTSAVEQYRYNPNVFILPPWIEIYHTDNERKQDFNIAVETYNIMLQAYRKSGYNPIIVPRLTVEERADFVLYNCDLHETDS